jgi:hypothetical protein
MQEKRTVKISIVLTPSVAARLDDYAQQSRWSRSTAATVLIESGLTAAEKNENDHND